MSAAGDHMEQQGTQTGKQQRGSDVEHRGEQTKPQKHLAAALCTARKAGQHGQQRSAKGAGQQPEQRIGRRQREALADEQRDKLSAHGAHRHAERGERSLIIVCVKEQEIEHQRQRLAAEGEE